ncbi:transposable element Tcb2 transposase [Trichonephila clavipes]|nr:transposable element Tcb2 transposase [Trichonephila clavipes]
MPQQLLDTLILSMGRGCETCLAVSGEIISPTKDRMFLAGHPPQGCFGLQSHCAPCYFFNQASFYPSDFSFIEGDPVSQQLNITLSFCCFPMPSDNEQSLTIAERQHHRKYCLEKKFLF